MGAATSVGSAEQAGGSDEGQLRLAFGHLVLAYGNYFRRMIKREIEVMMRTKEIEVLLIQIVHTAIIPIVEDLFRKIAKEEIQSATKNFLAGGNWINTNTETVTNERRLHLKFLDELPEDVLTGEVIKGKGGTPISVALVDEVTKQVIKSGPESSAKVEILLLEAGEHDDEHNWSHQDFNSRIIKECDKTKPHFPRSNYVSLEEGIGKLSNSKLAHDANWMKNCRCRLGARVVENLSGIKVLEARSESFKVSDSRSKLYVKHARPSLSDEVWRLVHIGRNGEPCKRLNKIKVWTVGDFLFFHSVDPQRLQKTVGAGANAWKAIVDHAQSCNITDTRIYKYNSAEHNMSVVFDIVGQLKGVIHDSQHVLINHLSEVEKDHAQKLLFSAFENQKDITCFGDERTTVPQFPHRGGFTATDTSTLENLDGCNPTIPEDANHCDPMVPSTLSQRISPSIEASNANDTLMHQVPDQSIYVATNTQEGFSGCNPPILENTNHYDPTVPSTSSQSIIPSIGLSGNADNTLMDVVPYGTSFPATNTSIQQAFSGCHPTIAESSNHWESTELGTSSQGISPFIGPLHNRNIVAFDSLELSMGLDMLEGLKGVIHDSQHALILEAEKDRLLKLLCPAFENWSGITFHSNESALMHQKIPHQANYAAANASIRESSPGCYPTIPENINHYDPTEPGTSSHSISPSVRPFGNANNAHMHQVPCHTSYAATNCSHGNYVTMADNTNHCDQTEAGTLSQIISPTGTSSNANNALVNQVPFGTSYTATNTSIQEGLPGRDPTIPVSIHNCESTEPGTSPQGMSPSIGTLGWAELNVSKRRRI